MSPRMHHIVDGEQPTCFPSGLLSLPPCPVLIYGFLVSGWMQLSLRASIASQT